MNVLRKNTFYPFLFAAHPIVFIYSQNVYETQLKEIVKPLIFSLLLTTIVLLVGRLIYKDLYKAAVSTSVFIIFFYSSGHFYNLLEKENFLKENLAFLSIILLYVFGLSMLFQGRKLLKILSIFTTILFSIYLLFYFTHFKLLVYDDLLMSCTIFWIVLMMFLIMEISILKVNFKNATISLNLSSLVLISFPMFSIIKAFLPIH